MEASHTAVHIANARIGAGVDAKSILLLSLASRYRALEKSTYANAGRPHQLYSRLTA